MCLPSIESSKINVRFELDEARGWLEKEPTKAQIRAFLRKVRVAVDEYDRREFTSRMAAAGEAAINRANS